MLTSTMSGKLRRLARLSRRGDGRFLFVPMDHSVSDGPIATAERFGPLVRAVAEGGADAVIMHKGRARLLDPAVTRGTGLVVHLSAGTSHALDIDAKTLVGGVEEAVSQGADAVSVHVNIGSVTEAAQLRDLGRVVAAADAWGLPVMAMIYARGAHLAAPHAAATVAHIVNIAADLGADIVKTAATRPAAHMAEVVAHCPVPVVVAGGADDGSDLLSFAGDMMAAGCAGLAVGRRVFRHPAPRMLVRGLAEAVHGPSPTAPYGPASAAPAEASHGPSPAGAAAGGEELRLAVGR
ncbi:2-amino-3,7-dideoxy-D-threo-hept-6-ulosonate synthase [Sphaerisporangium corydalis]|uniref:2-amino-3,7-dideoxy-D-threo-hept-6-ulosonate synthase n=1 Tax=Sphaerisporangium corydalis TaxID=1441875 RepID=A0ABV9E5N2_9ACTN|nr:2-amino-3,7-dideoxy-D-threo-hept-6-ulosonate synthase [Sphaerisporangium corydalis]